eukprot:Partr_v1_DN25579_c0_g1_i1_m20541 putative Protein phosphatase 2, regulatory subunit B
MRKSPAVAALEKFNRTNKLPVDPRLQEERHFSSLSDVQRSKQKLPDHGSSSVAGASFAVIPKFYFKKPSQSDSPIALSLKKSAYQFVAERKNEEILTNDDLDSIWQKLDELSQKQPDGTGKLTYSAYKKIGQQVPSRYRKYFKPSLYLRLLKENETKIDSQIFFDLILRRASLLQERVCISLYDTRCDGYLTEKEFETYVRDLLPNFPQLDSLETDFTSFYLCGVVRKFFFFLDPLRKGRIALRDVIPSTILSEFFELQQPELAPNLLLSNWFSLYSALKIYAQFIDLDLDKNGMLSADELAKFAKGRYTRSFTDRVFQEYQTFNGELDYKTFIDFVLTMNDLTSKSAITYAFRLLDIGNKGYLDRQTISYFVRTISERVFMPVNQKDLINEIFDMSHPSQFERISLQDMLRSGVGGTVISLLVDIHALIQNQAKD